MRRVPGILALLATFACGGATSSRGATAVGSTPCIGSHIDFDVATTRCRSNAEPTTTPSSADLALTLEPVTVRSGAVTSLIFRMSNLTQGPLHIVFHEQCAFELTLLDAAGQWLPFEGEVAMGGLSGCGFARQQALDFTLEPGGVFQRSIPWSANNTRLVAPPPRPGVLQAFHEEKGSPLAPGAYQIEVTSPFSDQVGDDPRHTRARRVRASVTVLP